MDTQIKAELNRIDYVFSTYKPTSEISLINEDPNRVWSDEFRNLFNLSNEISNLSEGAFSPNDANGFDFSAIGKGYAIDKIAELMEKNGVNNYFIENEKLDFLFGSVEKYKLMYGYKPWKLSWSFGFYTSHSVGFFIKTDKHKMVGFYNQKFLSADLDFFYKMIKKFKLKGISSKKK